jgi:hypothetical protein
MDSRRVAGFTCGAHRWISFCQHFDPLGDFIIQRKQVLEFRFAFYPTSARIYVFMQPFNSARSVFGIYRSAVGQFAIQHNTCLISGLTDEYPVAWEKRLEGYLTLIFQCISGSGKLWTMNFHCVPDAVDPRPTRQHESDTISPKTANFEG